MTEQNKVLFGLQNVHYAPYKVTESGIVFQTPLALPGGVEISLEPRGDLVEFYADNMLYYSAANNQGYDGTLSIANIPDHFLMSALGEELDEEDEVITEYADKDGSPFALMFQFEGDVKAVRHLLYNCTANRPTIASSTKTDSVEPNANELTFVSSPIDLDGNRVVKTKTTTKTPEATYNSWFDSVYLKSGLGA